MACCAGRRRTQASGTLAAGLRCASTARAGLLAVATLHLPLVAVVLCRC
jgi:hypothetical protein